MEKETLNAFNLIGISVRTTNENQQAGLDIPKLWEKFMSESILAAIPNKVDQTIYCMYTDYEKDYTRPYTTILGCQVSTLDDIPVGMVGKRVESGQYSKFTAKGSLLEGVVFKAWEEIWRTDLQRAYTADFEVYGENAQNPQDATVDIFIALES